MVCAVGNGQWWLEVVRMPFWLRCLLELKLYKRKHRIQSLCSVALGGLLPLPHLFSMDGSISLPVFILLLQLPIL